jgi:hypothetical protein
MRSLSLPLRARILRAAAIAIPLALTLGPVAFAIVSCNTQTNLVNKGGECFLASDCAPGLVCVLNADKQRVCTDDISGVAGRPPPEGGPPREAGEGGDADPDAPQPVEDSGTDTSKPDTALPDTGPADTGSNG